MSKRHHSDADKPARNLKKTAIAVEGFLTCVQQVFLCVMWADIIQKIEKARQKVKFQKETSYAVHQQELANMQNFCSRTFREQEMTGWTPENWRAQ